MNGASNLFSVPYKGGGKSTASTIAEVAIAIPAGVTGVIINADAPVYIAIADTVANLAALAVNDTNYGRLAIGTQTLRFQDNYVFNTIRWSPETAVATNIRYTWIH